MKKPYNALNFLLLGDHACASCISRGGSTTTEDGSLCNACDYREMSRNFCLANRPIFLFRRMRKDFVDSLGVRSKIALA